MIAFIFPGQGAQHVGMGVDIAERYRAAAAVYEQADQLLGLALSRLMAEGPSEQLTATEVAQPALLTHSVAVLRVLEAQGLQPDVVAGHSLGEYSALVAAGALDFESALQLVRQRGLLMAQDGKRIGGTMAAIIGLAPHQVEDVINQAACDGEVLVVANYNCPGQVVISGTMTAVEQAQQLAKEAGARATIALKVSGAFHSPLMATTAQRFGKHLQAAGINDAQLPVVSNVDATERTDAPSLVNALEQQIDHSILWEKSVRRMIQMGARRFIEVGPKRVLTKMMGRIDQSVEAIDTGDVEAVEAAVATA